MNQQQVLAYLDQVEVKYQIVNHPSVYTAAEADQYVRDYQFAKTKNLFLKSKGGYYLVVMLENKRLDMKKLKEVLHTSRFSFAQPAALTAKLGISSGAVSPFNLLNNTDHDIKLVFDRDILSQSRLIGCHPNDNTATVILSITDLLALIKQWGNSVITMTL